MNIKEAIDCRHSVRKYKDIPIKTETIEKLNNYITQLNNESGLNIQLVTDESKAFDSFLSHYGKFSGVKNYFAMIGKKSNHLFEDIGYYGEKLVLFSQMEGLNTCWVALTYKKVKGTYKLNKGEKLCMVIAVGYGENQGVERSSKKPWQVANVTEQTPLEYYNGVKSALKAPTAMNQQKFFFHFNENKVKVSCGKGFYTKTDMGIVRLHFEIGAGKDNFKWG